MHNYIFDNVVQDHFYYHHCIVVNFTKSYCNQKQFLRTFMEVILINDWMNNEEK